MLDNSSFSAPPLLIIIAQSLSSLSDANVLRGSSRVPTPLKLDEPLRMSAWETKENVWKLLKLGLISG